MGAEKKAAHCGGACCGEEKGCGGDGGGVRGARAGRRAAGEHRKLHARRHLGRAGLKSSAGGGRSASSAAALSCTAAHSEGEEGREAGGSGQTPTSWPASILIAPSRPSFPPPPPAEEAAGGGGAASSTSSARDGEGARPRKVPTCRLLACQTSTTDPSRSVPLGGGSIRGGGGAAGLEGDCPLPGDAARRGPRTAAGQRGCVERGGAKRGVVRPTQRSRFASIEPAVR